MTEAQVFAVVKDAIIAILGAAGEKASMEGTLRDLGANSLDRMEIVTLSMENLGLHFPPRELSGVKDIGGLVTFLHGRLNKA